MHYTHNIDPIALSLFGLDFPWYWLSYLLGFIWVIFHGHYLTQKKISPLPSHNFWQQLQWGWPALFLGARFFYIFIYNWEFFRQRPELIPQIWLGGMSFHGALIGIALSGLILSRIQRSSFWSYTDVLATTAPIGLFFGRIANFINGELAGKATDLPWAVIFPNLYDHIPRHPSQLYQAATEGLALFIILNLIARRTLATPGLQTSYFLIGYGGFRFFTEFFRLPDPQLGTWLGLSMGQYLCLFMVAGGLTIKYLFIKGRNHTTKTL